MSEHFQTMKTLPILERPYEKCEKYGISNLSDAELLAIIVQTGTRGEKVIDLAYALLSINEQYPGLEGLIRSTKEELVKIKGIGSVKAIKLLAVFELAKRMNRLNINERLAMNHPANIADFYMDSLSRLAQEELHLMMLDTKNRLIKEQLLTKGTVNLSLIDPREIFIHALRNQAVSIILVHNHPSGDTTPSKEDLLATGRVKQAGDMIGIPLIDHIIIGYQSYTSLCQMGYI